MFDPIQFFSPSYLFDISPSSYFPSYWIVLGFCVLLIFVAVFLFFYTRSKSINPVLKRTLKSIPGKLEIFALVGIVLTFLRLSGAYYLSMRFLLVIWFVLFVWYFVHISKKIKQYPEQLQQHVEREEDKKHHFKPKIKKRKKKGSRN